ncbi:MSC_0624 family F1-like ATPase-associated membrane protein [Mycoplasmopsis adleri]|uniref:MSC_0624 family F1-like ATPase-associated membrane protein n=1 Tax=Mycoplasmopsis adleri TaxID=51362 RepID=UPI003872E9B1
MTNTTAKQSYSKKYFSFDKALKVFSWISFVTFALTILFQLPIIFGTNTQDIEASYLGYAKILDFSNSTYASRNFALWINFSILTFVSLYSLFVGYKNYFKNILTVVKNRIFYFAYWLLSFGALLTLLLVKYDTDLNPLILFYQSFFIVGLMIINLLFLVISNLTIKKVNPAELYLLKYFYISWILKAIALSLWLTFIYLITFNSYDHLTDNILVLSGNNANPFYAKLSAFFTGKNPGSYFVIILVVAIILSFIALDIVPYLYGINIKNRRKYLIKPIFTFIFLLTFALIIWMLTSTYTLNKNLGLFADVKPKHYIYVITLVLMLAIFLTYVLVLQIKTIKKSSASLKSFITFLSILLTSLVAFSFRIKNFDAVNNYVIILFYAIFIALITVVDSFKNKSQIALWQKLINSIILAFVIPTIFLCTLNSYIQNVNKFNDIMNIFSLNINICDLFILINVFIATIAILIQVIIWIYSAIYIQKYKKQEEANSSIKKEVAHEKEN